MSDDTTGEREPLDLEAALALIRDRTPEDYVWRLRVEEEFGLITLRITLRRQGWRGVLNGPRWSVEKNVNRQRTTPASFYEGTLAAAIELLNDRASKIDQLRASDWAQLARELQDLLNGIE